MRKAYLISFVALAFGLNVATAASLLLDMGQTSVAAPYLTLSPGHSLATISGSETSWNTINSSGPFIALVYGDGTAASGVSLILGQGLTTAGNTVIDFSTAIVNVNLVGTGGGSVGQQSLLGLGSIYGDDGSSTAVGRDGMFGGGNSTAGAPVGLRLDGLTAGDYFVYVMARNVNGNALGASPMNVYGAAGSSAGTFDFSSFTPHLQYNTNYAAATYAGEYTSFVNGENYVGFTVTVAAGESLFVAVDGATSGAAPNENRAFLNMVEIVAVPEPGALSLFAMGIGALVVTFRKRKRS